MPEISKIKLTSGAEYDIKDATAREMILSHTYSIDTELSTTSTNPVQNSIITNALANKADSAHTHTNESMGFGYGECSTAAAAKTASITNYTLSTGGIVSIKFTYGVPANATLNINSKGAKPIYHNRVAITANIIKADDIATFIYDGARYNLIATNNISNVNMGFGYGECSTAAATTAKTVSMANYKLSTGGIVSIKFNYDVLANATLNINFTGAKSIYYNGAAITDGIIKAGDTATFIYDGTNYNLISLDRDFNKKETGTLSCRNYRYCSNAGYGSINNSNSTYNLTGTYIKYNDLVRIYISLEINNLVVMPTNDITYYIMNFNTNLPLPDSTISERFNLNINDFSAFDYDETNNTISINGNSYHNIKWIGYIKSGKIILCLIANNLNTSCSNFKLNISGEYPI